MGLSFSFAWRMTGPGRPAQPAGRSLPPEFLPGRPIALDLSPCGRQYQDDLRNPNGRGRVFQVNAIVINRIIHGDCRRILPPCFHIHEDVSFCRTEFIPVTSFPEHPKGGCLLVMMDYVF